MTPTDSLLFSISLFSLLLFSVFFLPYSHAEKDLSTDDSQKKLDDEQHKTCNCVAFRLDDIQGYFLNESQIAIMDTFSKKQIPLTIGIIGSEKAGFGSDLVVTDFVKNELEKESPMLEIANHGWAHESFPSFTKDEQKSLIDKTTLRLEEILDVSPSVFIPPYNEFNSDTLSALKDSNFSHISGSLELSEPPYPLTGQEVFHFPETTTTGYYDKKSGKFKKLPHDVTLYALSKNLQKYGFAVVTMHPQEFSISEDVVDQNQLKELEILLEKIQNSNLKIVFLSNIEKNVLDDSKIFEDIFKFDNHLSPKLQMNLGIPDDAISCNDDLKLIIKSNNDFPACVNEESFFKLLERNWGKLP